MITWQNFGSGYEAFVGPLRLFVYRRGLWVADVVHLRERHGCHGLHSFHQERDILTAADAKNRAEDIARGWLTAEIEEIQQVLEEADGPLHIPCHRGVKTKFFDELVRCRLDADHQGECEG